MFYPLIESHSTVQKFIFDDTDTNMVGECVHLLLTMLLNLKLYFTVSQAFS